MKWIVTGGAGFIGGNFVHYVLNAHPDYELVVLDKLTYAGNLETLKAVMHKIKFVRGDIADRKTVFELVEAEKPDAIINFAAESHVDRSIENPGLFLTANVIGTQVLLDACRTYHVKRFHQVSTDEVYGDLPLDRPDLRFTEAYPLKASSPYSASKAGADLLVLAYCRTYDLFATISRCSNNYGPYQFPEKLIPLMILNCLAKKKLPVYGDGKNVRDWLYVTDHCSAIDLILHKGCAGEVYNIGGNNELPNIEIVKTIIDSVGASHDLISYVKDRKGHDRRYAIDSTKMKLALGWAPETDFDSGIQQTVRWYLENEAWWRCILTGEYESYYARMYENRQA